MNYLEYKERPHKGYGFIYKYTSPSNRCYIGQTTYSIYERARKNGIGYKNCSAFYGAIKKYGIDNFQVEILEEVPEELLEEKERQWIDKFNSILPNGYNYCHGGSSARQTKASTAIDVYDLQLVKIDNFESLIECAKSYGIPWQAISQCINHKIEHYKNWVFVKHNEQPQSPHVSKTCGRIVGQYNDEYELLNTFPSANEAAREIGTPNLARNIRSVCEGKRQHACGYRWKYLD